MCILTDQSLTDTTSTFYCSLFLLVRSLAQLEPMTQTLPYAIGKNNLQFGL
jgi:hypothetical protein